jgi:hypothetical protein
VSSASGAGSQSGSSASGAGAGIQSNSGAAGGKPASGSKKPGGGKPQSTSGTSSSSGASSTSGTSSATGSSTTASSGSQSTSSKNDSKGSSTDKSKKPAGSTASQASGTAPNQDVSTGQTDEAYLAPPAEGYLPAEDAEDTNGQSSSAASSSPSSTAASNKPIKVDGQTSSVSAEVGSDSSVAPAVESYLPPSASGTAPPDSYLVSENSAQQQSSTQGGKTSGKGAADVDQGAGEKTVSTGYSAPVENYGKKVHQPVTMFY